VGRPPLHRLIFWSWEIGFLRVLLQPALEGVAFRKPWSCEGAPKLRTRARKRPVARGHRSSRAVEKVLLIPPALGAVVDSGGGAIPASVLTEPPPRANAGVFVLCAWPGRSARYNSEKTKSKIGRIATEMHFGS
jgi:hypothetical protein